MRLSDKHSAQIILQGHIEIAFAVALLITLDAVPLFWKWTDCLREKCKLRGEDREFSLVCIEELSCYSDKVSEINEFLCKLVC